VLLHHTYFHWLYYNGGKKALFNFITGLFIWFFLAFARPFGISITNVSVLELIAFLLPIGILWILLVYFIELITIKWLGVPIHQNVKADLIAWAIKIILYIHIIWAARGLACDWECLDAFEYLELWIGLGLLIGLVYLPSSLYARYIHYHKALSYGAPSASTMIINGEGNDFAKITPEEVVFIKADDNYSDFGLSDGKKVSLRSSLTSTYKQLIQHPQFIRTHRSYVINSQFFDSYKRSQGSITLKVKDQLFDIPVSKSYKEAIDNYFSRPK
jgi:hypothetical protein